MPRVSRRRLIRTAGVAGAFALAGCSADGDDDPVTETPTTTGTPTATSTPTPTPRLPADESLGFEALLAWTPTHPETPDRATVWARYLDAAPLLADVDDDTVRQRLRQGWLGSGPPAHTDADAFELVHVQPATLPNVTLGRGDYDAETAVAGMRADGWTESNTERPEAYLTHGGYAAAVGERFWIVTSVADADTVASLVASMTADPLVGYLDDVDLTAVARATEERGNYAVVERSVPGDYAAGIAVDYEPHRFPVGVLQYAAGRASPSWERVERRFETRVAGELRASDFGDDFG